MKFSLVPVLALICAADGFYLPGIAPVSYCQDDTATCKVSNSSVCI